MKTYIPLIILFLSYNLCAQTPWFFMPDFLEIGYPGMSYNIESFDINRDEHLDIVSGNWNTTTVYFGGYGTLDTVKDLTYLGRMLAICDYNGDGFDDMITLHFTSYDSTKFDYNGNLLFYWGSDTSFYAIDTIPDVSIPLPTQYPTIEQFSTGYFTVGVKCGDFNGDGKTDIVINSINDIIEPYGTVNTGKVYIYMGKTTPTDTADFVLKGQIRQFPYQDYGGFFDVGDINGDNLDELLISANQTRFSGITYDSVNYLYVFNGNENFQPFIGGESATFPSFVNPPDSIAGWFLREFSVDDINGDGIDDIVIGRSFYNYPHQTDVHYGSSSGIIDTIPSFSFIQDTTAIQGFFSAGAITQSVGDFNMDGYDDFIISPAGYKLFCLQLGGPYVSNSNRYGQRGYSNAGDVFPRKSINLGDQTNDGVNDIAVLGGGYVLFLYGQSIPTSIKDQSTPILGFNLYQNYPNPFNPSTRIGYQLNEGGYVKLNVYDIKGELVEVLVNGWQERGYHEVEFEGEVKSQSSKVNRRLASGVYIYQIVVKNGNDIPVFSDMNKMILLK